MRFGEDAHGSRNHLEWYNWSKARVMESTAAPSRGTPMPPPPSFSTCSNARWFGQSTGKARSTRDHTRSQAQASQYTAGYQPDGTLVELVTHRSSSRRRAAYPLVGSKSGFPIKTAEVDSTAEGSRRMSLVLLHVAISTQPTMTRKPKAIGSIHPWLIVAGGNSVTLAQLVQCETVSHGMFTPGRYQIVGSFLVLGADLATFSQGERPSRLLLYSERRDCPMLQQVVPQGPVRW